MKKAWILGSVLGLAVAGLGASDAHALRSYTQAQETLQYCDTHKDCCAATSATQVGAFDLTDVSTDKDAARTCSLGAKGCQHAHGNKPCPLTGALDLVVKPVEAVLNDAHLLITMPYRKAEPLN